MSEKKWIRTGEKMPYDDQEILVTLKWHDSDNDDDWGYEVKQGVFFYEDGEPRIYFGYMIIPFREAIAWMPLPKPFEEDVRKTIWLSFPENLEKYDIAELCETGMPLAAYSTLRRAGIQTLKDLYPYYRDDLMKFRGIGKVTANKISDSFVKWLAQNMQKSKDAE